MQKELLFGTDPECAAVYEKNGVIYSYPPFGFRELLGVPVEHRNEKHPEFMKGDGWKIIEDGANFEFTIRPSHNPADLFAAVQDAKKVVESKILVNFPDYCLPELQFLPTVAWEVEKWNELIALGIVDEELFEMSTTFGCDPDEDEFDLEAKCKILDVKNHPERYCGGHLHVSGSSRIMEDHHLAVRCMVITAGLAAVAFSDVPDLEKRRTFHYGKPGRFRVQNYGDNPFGDDYRVGIEYRTCSARWLSSWEIAGPVLHWAGIGIHGLLETSLGEELTKELVEEACPTILSADQGKAREILAYIETRL